MLDEFRTMVRSRNYEVSIHIESDQLTANFPTRYQYPKQQGYSVVYKLDTIYPKYVIYHLIMGDVIRKCKSMDYDPALINLYHQDESVSISNFVQHINLTKEERCKHNKIGELIHAVAQFGPTPRIAEEAKQAGVFEYLKLIIRMSGVYNE